MQIELTGEWTQLDYTTGQIQNLDTAAAIEVSEETENGSGQVVFPKESMSFDGPTLFAVQPYWQNASKRRGNRRRPYKVERMHHDRIGVLR